MYNNPNSGMSNTSGEFVPTTPAYGGDDALCMKMCGSGIEKELED